MLIMRLIINHDHDDVIAVILTFALAAIAVFFFFVAADVVVHEDNYCFYSFPILTPFFSTEPRFEDFFHGR